MSTVAKGLTVDAAGVIIDGQEFPWAVMVNGASATTDGRTQLVTLTLPVRGPVVIDAQRRREGDGQ